VNFEEYLVSKNIDSASFKKQEPDLWKDWFDLYEQVSPASFTSQKLYQINPTRRKFVLKEKPPVEKKIDDIVPSATPAIKPGAKPVFKPKMK